MKRREFLTRVGIAGGAGAMYATMDAMGLIASPLNAPAAYAQATSSFTPPSRMDFGLKGSSDKQVVVLGAGIAGLTTAYELGKAGYRVTILEARDRPGGRNWTARTGTKTDELTGPVQTAAFGDGNYMNMGPARLAGHMVTLDYCRELGVAIEGFANQNADAFYFNDPSASASGGLTGTPVRHRTQKADTYGYISELLHKAIDQGALNADLNASDKERVLAFLRNFGALNADRKYTGTPRRGYDVEPAAGTQPGVVRSPPASLSDVFSSGLSNNLTFEFGYDQAMMMFQPVGGMDRIAYAFEAAVRAQMRTTGGQIVYNAPVRTMDNTATGVRVVVGSGSAAKTYTADFCVCTIPPTVLRKVSSNISQSAKRAIAYPVGVNTGKIGLDYKRRWWEEDQKIFGGITNNNLGLGTIWYPSHGYLGSSGLVVGYYNFGADATRYGNLLPADRLRDALAAGKRIHGDAYETELRSSLSVAWEKTRYSEGGWVSWPSRTDGVYERALRPEGNIYFAGDHLSYYIAWQAGAIESARLAVTALHSRVVQG